MGNIPKVSRGTWIRTIILFVTLINAVLTMYHKQPLPINDDDVNNLVSAVAVVAAAIAAWWKDNAFTKKARVHKQLKKPPEK